MSRISDQSSFVPFDISLPMISSKLPFPNSNVFLGLEITLEELHLKDHLICSRVAQRLVIVSQYTSRVAYRRTTILWKICYIYEAERGYSRAEFGLPLI